MIHEVGDVVAEHARGWHGVVGRGLVDVGVEGDGGLDGVGELGILESFVDVLESWKGGVREAIVVESEEGLIADGHVAVKWEKKSRRKITQNF